MRTGKHCVCASDGAAMRRIKRLASNSEGLLEYSCSRATSSRLGATHQEPDDGSTR